MRDLERIEERSSDEGRGVLVLSGVGLVAAIGIVVAAVAALPDGNEPPREDPLQMLAIADGVEALEATEEPARQLRPKADLLLEGSHDFRYPPHSSYPEETAQIPIAHFAGRHRLSQ